MTDVTVKKMGDFEAIFGGAFHRVRAGLGVESFGMQVIEAPPNADRYPEHDHLQDGQEEVYVALEGSAILRVGDEEWTLEPGTFARVGPGEKRHIRTTDQACRFLCLGGVPGQAYELSEFGKAGAPDPTAA